MPTIALHLHPSLSTTPASVQAAAKQVLATQATTVHPRLAASVVSQLSSMTLTPRAQANAQASVAQIAAQTPVNGGTALVDTSTGNATMAPYGTPPSVDQSVGPDGGVTQAGDALYTADSAAGRFDSFWQGLGAVGQVGVVAGAGLLGWLAFGRKKKGT